MSTPTPSQRYLSTRGGSYGFTFEEAVLKGLASDNGLFIPESIPSLPSDWLTAWSTLSFQDLAFEILSLYISPSEIPHSDLRDLINRSYSTFRHPSITPTHHLSSNLEILELFHGPTFAFKDVALQLVGNLFEYFLVRKNEKLAAEGKPRHALTVVGATSGDTGSAAIYGLRGKKDVSVFILHPHGRVSPIQEAQMTTVLDSNVHNLAVSGTFDDCQDIVKTLFSDPDFNSRHNLGAVNSINWARILAQIVYYFSAFFQLGRREDLQFVVPTGNFGDVLAGYFAKRMGLPMGKLCIATNENDILDRFCRSGRYEKQEGAEVAATLSPAMDILVSSNFERLLWYLALEHASNGIVAASGTEEQKKTAGETVAKWMSDLKTSGGTAVPEEVLAAMRRDFDSERVDDETTIATIKSTFQEYGYVLDPHTAVGVAAARRLGGEGVKVSLSTAHPAKFAEAVEKALGGCEGYEFEKVRPREFVGLEERERRVVRVEEASVGEVKKVVEELLAKEGKQ